MGLYNSNLGLCLHTASVSDLPLLFLQGHLSLDLGPTLDLISRSLILSAETPFFFFPNKVLFTGLELEHAHIFAGVGVTILFTSGSSPGSRTKEGIAVIGSFGQTTLFIAMLG